MKKCILTIGVSGSGKTTWAEQFIKDNPTWININRDELRHQFVKDEYGKEFSWKAWKRKDEKVIYDIWWDKINEAVANKYIEGIIISDTNLSSSTRNKLFNFFQTAGFVVEFKLFNIDFETAVERDMGRPNPVGYSVIAQQMEKFNKQFKASYIKNEQLPKAIVVDVDGTLAKNTTRSPFEWSRVDEDTPNELVVAVVKAMKASGIKIIILSGRDSVCREKTENWLEHFLGFKPDGLFMRKSKDNRKDSIIKEELFFDYIAHKYNIIGVIDDRPQVWRMWRSLGLETLIVGNPLIEF